MNTQVAPIRWTQLTKILLGATIFLSFCTYFVGYWNPPALFWDENYHIASAQKYLNGVFFMEPHPPLGKLLIAAGEKMFHSNSENNQFVDTSYGRDLPQGFSFVGYRFFSAFLAWWTAPILFWILLMLLKKEWYAFFFSFPYIFDNALIVHSRGAMLEGPLMFFAALSTLAFLLVLKDQHHRTRFILWSALYGAAFSAALTTKLIGLIVILFTLPIAYALLPQWKKIVQFAITWGVSALVVFCGVWYLHFTIASTVNPKLESYTASPAYFDILRTGQAGNPLNFPLMLRDNFAFVSHYNDGVPKLNLCKADENGSPAFYWPVGARSINYRWNTPDGQSYQYLYLQANPAGWWLALVGVVLAIGLLASHFFFAPKEKFTNLFFLLVFVGVYSSYMIAISRISRVMYLYHYFTPLFMSFIILALVWNELENIGTRKITERMKQKSAMIFGGIVVVTFLWYSPLTYYGLLTKDQFQLRNIFSLWDLKCVGCEGRQSLYIPGSSS